MSPSVVLLLAFLVAPGSEALDPTPAEAAPARADSSPPLLLGNATLLDGTGAEPVSGVWIRVRDGRIAAVSRSALEPEEGERVVDLEGRWVLPGFIDAHVHVSELEQARRALRSGVTTVRSAGVGHFADVGLAELKERGHAPDVPEVVAAGYHVRPEPAEAFFLDHPELGGLLEGGVTTPDGVREMVRTMAGHDVEFVKVNATARAGLPETDPRESLYGPEELTALVEEADDHGLPVMAHAHGDEGARAAVEAGVRSIEHGTYLSEETVRRMAERGTYLVPTIAIVRDLIRPGGDYDVPFLRIRGHHMLPRLREAARRAHRHGVPLVASTDTGYGPESVTRIGHELEELVGVGLTPMEAIRAATSTAAELLRVDDHTGTVAEGMDADLVVLDASPLEDIRHAQDVLMVVNDGTVAVDRMEW